ncbi:unnamed protein product [Penicillium olsonii]|uniref:3-isopropylmalate dehydratase n=1 Tax=Penicillium olsonii TaxID=99116 RepID=A0A9W4MMD8_PENOL|nr:unnamed protein product [Penicillium olsonii]
MAPRTLYDKVFDRHVVDENNGLALLYIDRHLIHEVTSPQAFEGLRNAGRQVRRPECTLATADHNVPTTSRNDFESVDSFIEEEESRIQVLTMERNAAEYGVQYFGLGDKRQGIVHVIGPEQGFTLPGTTVVCGDSHTSTHGAFGALAFGIGTSEVEHVLATQTLRTMRSKNMKIQIDGDLLPGTSSKDIILHIIGLIGTTGGTGAVVEFCGSTIRALSIEARMSICNMTIEAGARAGLIAPDEKTYAYLKNRPMAPAGSAWDAAVSEWSTLFSDEGASFDSEIYLDAKNIPPSVTWGTSPQDTVSITGIVPSPSDFADPLKAAACATSLKYMGLTPGTRMEDLILDKVFIGSCTNSRMEDLRAAANIVRGKKIASTLKCAMVVPGSGLIKARAEKEGLHHIFLKAGFEWREAGCSMCLGMNTDILDPGERCASTSNRNFEGRQGNGGRTHLVSPIMAAAAALTGRLTDVRQFLPAAAATVVHDAHSHSVEGDSGSASEVEEESERSSDISFTFQPSSGSSTPSLGIQKFTTLRGIAAPIDRNNVDTDAIIPKQFLKTIKRTGLGSALFYPLRVDSDGKETDFILNQGVFRSASILVSTGSNFGCGSSREHAPWALLDFGIRCIIADSFADIFYNNTFKNGMLSIVLSDKAALGSIAKEAATGREIEVDLENQEIRDSCGVKLAGFEVDAFRKHCLLNGLDEIGLTMGMENKISAYEQRLNTSKPWLKPNPAGRRNMRPSPKRDTGSLKW